MVYIYVYLKTVFLTICDLETPWPGTKIKRRKEDKNIFVVEDRSSFTPSPPIPHSARKFSPAPFELLMTPDPQAPAPSRST